jgi:hypothetical protein
MIISYFLEQFLLKIACPKKSGIFEHIPKGTGRGTRYTINNLFK